MPNETKYKLCLDIICVTQDIKYRLIYKLDVPKFQIFEVCRMPESALDITKAMAIGDEIIRKYNQCHSCVDKTFTLVWAWRLGGGSANDTPPLRHGDVHAIRASRVSRADGGVAPTQRRRRRGSPRRSAQHGTAHSQGSHSLPDARWGALQLKRSRWHPWGGGALHTGRQCIEKALANKPILLR